MLFQYLDDVLDFSSDEKENKFNSIRFFSDKIIKERIATYLQKLDHSLNELSIKTSSIQLMVEELFVPLKEGCYV